MNQVKQSTMIDLHGLSAQQAREKTQNTIRNLANPDLNTESIRFVTGRGNHPNTKGERGTLYKEFKQWLNDSSFTFKDKITSVKSYDGYYEVKLAQKDERKSFVSSFIKDITSRIKISLTNNIENIKQKAVHGDPESQYILAACYDRGENGIEQNYHEAAKLYRKAAEQGFYPAQYALGSCYFIGKGVRQNDQEAIIWFKKAADQKDPVAELQMGDIYHYAYGLKEPDHKLANCYYAKAAAHGYVLAFRRLAGAYHSGLGTAKNLQKAFSFYLTAADRDDPYSQYNVAIYYLHGELVNQDISKAIHYLTLAAENSDADAQFFLGMAYDSDNDDFSQFISEDIKLLGKHLQKNNEEAIKLLKKSADNNSSQANYFLSTYYESRNSKNSLAHLIKAAELGNIGAQFEIAFAHRQNENIPEEIRKRMLEQELLNHDEQEIMDLSDKYKYLIIDLLLFPDSTREQQKKGLHLLLKLAKANSITAFNRLGILYTAGDDERSVVKQNFELAVDYWRKGANLGDLFCLQSLAYSYEIGNGVKQDLIQAISLYEQAIKQQSAYSANQLALLYLNGKFVNKNVLKAHDYFLKAISWDELEQKRHLENMIFGCPYVRTAQYATFNLGRLYLMKEENFSHKEMEGIQWLEKAEQLGHHQARTLINLFERHKKISLKHNQSKPNFFGLNTQDRKVGKEDVLDTKSSLLSAGKIAQQQARWNDARNYYQEALTIDPECFDALSGLVSLCGKASGLPRYPAELMAAILYSKDEQAMDNAVVTHTLITRSANTKG